MTRTIAALLVCVSLAAAPAFAQEPRSDRLVFDQIADQVHRYTQYTIFDSVTASVDSGHVVLAGWVTQPHKRDDIERRIRRVAGVRTLDNAIQVLPSSPSDDQLRFRIARAIYGNATFWHYASLPNPPIHIIVNRGAVILDGVVYTNLERMLARTLAGGFGAVELINQLRTDAEVRETLNAISE